jgi:hypothetical protein
MANFFQSEEVAVYVNLIIACVVREGDDVSHTMTLVAKNLNDKTNIYHGGKCTRVRQRRHLAKRATW